MTTNTADDLIHLLVQDEQFVVDALQTATASGQHSAVLDCLSHNLMGTRVALGRALAWREGLPEREHRVTAYNRGRDHADGLRAAAPTGSNADADTLKETASALYFADWVRRVGHPSSTY